MSISGSRFGRLLVLREFEERSAQGCIRWVCMCDCGNLINTPITSNLKRGTTKSCGCFRKDRQHASVLRHGKSREKDPTYSSWCDMKYRCSNPRLKEYRYYGGRGIDVCARWNESFENFFLDMGERPHGMTLDRIDVEGGYSKENCRWECRSVQNYNQRVKVTNSSGITGVSFSSKTGLWRAYISKDGKRIGLGSHNSFDSAVSVRRLAELEHFGFNKL